MLEEREDDSLKLWVERELRETRHALRQDIAAMGIKIADAVLLSTRDLTEMRGEQKALRYDVDSLKTLAPRVQALEQSDLADHAAQTATAKLRASMWRQTFGLGGLIVAVASVIVAKGG